MKNPPSKPPIQPIEPTPPEREHRLMKFALLLLCAIIIVAAIFYFTGMTPDSLNEQLTGLGGLSSPRPTAALVEITPTPAPSPTEKPQQVPGVVTDPAGLLPRKGELTVTVLDVGQADSIFIQSPSGKSMLIDAGESSAKEVIFDYLDRAGIKKIDVLVATHPHSDHIGAMKAVVERYDIGTVYMPKVSHTSETYQNLLEAIAAKGKKIKAARGGKEKTIAFDDKLSVRVLAPISSEYEELNDYSVILRIDYENSSFLLTGDAEKLSENEMLKAYPELLKVDVLKVGHHGSSTSTGEKFLDAVDPEYGIISCGEDNSYDHPNPETLKTLEKGGVSVLRTDQRGTIAVFTDGSALEIVTEKD